MGRHLYLLSPGVDAVMPSNVFVLGASSDIGRELVVRYLRAGCTVAGTYRNHSAVEDLRGRSRTHLFPCSVDDQASITQVVQSFSAQVGVWDTFISSIGTEEPIGPFFDNEFEAWESSVIVNSTAQLRVLHQLYPYRSKRETCNVVFFAGGGTNNPFPNYSAYCVSKILLIKMCELLDDENKDLNVFILGPGFVRTKIHRQTLAKGASAGRNHGRTLEFLRADNPGTSFDDIFACINWAIRQGRDVCGGRNFSVVHDPWRRGGIQLVEELREDPNKFKLRRSGNMG